MSDPCPMTAVVVASSERVAAPVILKFARKGVPSTIAPGVPVVMPVLNNRARTNEVSNPDSRSSCTTRSYPLTL